MVSTKFVLCYDSHGLFIDSLFSWLTSDIIIMSLFHHYLVIASFHSTLMSLWHHYSTLLHYDSILMSFLLSIWMSVWWTQIGWMLLKWTNKWPRVKPGELDQTDGDCSTIIHQLNTQCPSGYVMGIHDIIAMRLYCHSLALLLLYNNTILTWYHDMICNIPTITLWHHHSFSIQTTYNSQAWSYSNILYLSSSQNLLPWSWEPRQRSLSQVLWATISALSSFVNSVPCYL